MVEQDQKLVRRDACLLRRRRLEELRMAHDVLVERLARRDQHAERRLLPPPRAAEPLPGCRDRSREAVEDRDVECADVDAEFERRGADHAIDAARAQAPFRRASFGRQVASAVRADPRGLARVVVEHVLEVLGQHLDHQARLREHDRLHLRADRVPREPHRLRTRRRADAEIGIDHRRVPQEHMPLADRRAALGDRMHGLAEQRLGMVLRIADCRRAQDEGRRHAVERTHSPQPPDHVRDMRAEHATVGVHLVDHDVAQGFEELRPLRVMRQDRLVQHVRVADDDVALHADRLARIGRRVAIERRREQPEPTRTIELEQLRHLVLRQRLGREQVQRLRLRRPHRLDHRQVVAERLARRGRRDHDHMPPGLHLVPRLALVAVKPLHAAPLERLAQFPRQLGREVRMARRLRRPAQVARDAITVLARPALDEAFDRRCFGGSRWGGDGHRWAPRGKGAGMPCPALNS